MRKAIFVVVLAAAMTAAGCAAPRDAAPASAAPSVSAASGAASGAPVATSTDLSAASGAGIPQNPWSEGTGALTFADAKAAAMYNRIFSEDERRAARAARDVAVHASGADVLRLLLRASSGRPAGESEEAYLDRRIGQLNGTSFKAPLADAAKAGRDAAVKSVSEKLGFAIPPFTETFVWSSYRRPDGTVARLFVPADALFFPQQANACAQDAAQPCHQDALKLGASGAFASAVNAFLSPDAAAYAARYDAGSLRKGFLELMAGAPSDDMAAQALFAQVQPFVAAAQGALGAVPSPAVPAPLARYALASGGLASDFANFVAYYWASRAGAGFPMPTDNALNPVLPKSSK